MRAATYVWNAGWTSKSGTWLPRRCIPSTGAQFENTLCGIETLARGEPLFQTN
jgi:hypothetical protein